MTLVRVVAVFVILVAVGSLVTVSYVVGASNGAAQQVTERVARDVELHRKTVALDRAFFEALRVRPSALATGHRTMEVQMADSVARTFTLELETSEGRATRIAGPSIQNVVIEGNTVSWEELGQDEAPVLHFVGVVSGDEMWGRVHRAPGQGWHEGEPPVGGVWRTAR